MGDCGEPAARASCGRAVGELWASCGRAVGELWASCGRAVFQHISILF